MRRCVLFISGREVGYMRNRVLLSALRSRFDVKVFTTDVPSTVGRTVSSLARFVACRPDYDLCFVGFYGQPIATALATLQRKPLLLDAYVSTYDTLCEDRCWFRPRSPMGRLAYWLDRKSCQSADHAIVDTDAHAGYFVETFGIPRDKFTTVYVGCDEALFYPRREAGSPQGRTDVFYYGAFLPLHGTDVIIRAASLLRDRSDIRFRIGGDGKRRRHVERLIDELELSNVELLGWIPLVQLPEYIDEAAICLGGHFSTVPKAARVIPTKVFQFVAMRKPTVVGDGSAVREIFTPGEHVWAVPMGSSDALATAVRTLADDQELRRHLALGGYEVFQRRLTTSTIADQLAHVVEQAL
ncbi:MAG: glycosyltransferase [Anaerolineae bacterium]